MHYLQLVKIIQINRSHNSHHTTICINILSSFYFSLLLVFCAVTKISPAGNTKPSLATALSTAAPFKAVDSLPLAIHPLEVYWHCTAWRRCNQCAPRWSCLWKAWDFLSYVSIKYRKSPLPWVPQYFTGSIPFIIWIHLQFAATREHKINPSTSKIQRITVESAG